MSTRYTTNDVIRVTCLVYNCARIDLVANPSDIYQRRREVAVTAAIRLGMEAKLIGRPFGMSPLIAEGAAEKIEAENRKTGRRVEPIIQSIVDGVRRKRAA